YSNVATIRSRDNYNGSVITLATGDVYGNRIIGGPHTGIFSGRGIANKIHDNSIVLHTRYTNDFAITLWDDQGSDVHHNVVDNGDADKSSRGIFVGGTSDGTVVHHNTVSVHELALNQEYGGAQMGGAYGIQLETSSNVEVYENTVNVNADEVQGAAFRINEGAVGAYVHDNRFTATRIGAGVEAATLKMAELNQASSFRFERNLLTTNSQWIGNTNAIQDIVLRSNTLKAEGDLTGFEAVECGNWQYDDPLALTIRDLRFVDNVYADAASRQLLSDSPVHNEYNNGIDVYSSFLHGFTTAFAVTDSQNAPVANAAITVTDKDNRQVFSGTTDASGTISAILDEFRTLGDVKTSYSPYTVTASANGKQVEQQFTADRTQTLTLQLGEDADTTPPTLSNITATGITLTAATVTWTTDEPANSFIQYGTGTVYGQSMIDTTLTTSHSLILTNLLPGTLYHYRVTSSDALGNSAMSEDFTFTTQGEGGPALPRLPETFETPFVLPQG
ncbi:MAG: fibronectin type III domain-containing protein, partial [Patescibacteria group bacterium]